MHGCVGRNATHGKEGDHDIGRVRILLAQDRVMHARAGCTARVPGDM
jgi:hypothetical protein